MSYHPDHETVGPGREEMLHLRRPGAYKTLCGVAVPVEWFAWSVELFGLARRSGGEKRCRACANAVGFEVAA